jgi:hypothetical protein
VFSDVAMSGHRRPFLQCVVQGAAGGSRFFSFVKKNFFSSTLLMQDGSISNGFSQRYLISSRPGDNLFCETKTLIRASPARVLAALQGPWTWWRGGAYDNRQVLPSGEISYELWPGNICFLKCLH